MDDLSMTLARQRVMGCPFHGLVRGSQLTLSNGQTIDGRWYANQVRGSYRVAVPGVVPVVRTAPEAATDALAGYQWRADAVINFKANNPTLDVYGCKSLAASALYAQSLGNCWSVALPFGMAANAGKTQLTAPATVTRFGNLSFDPPPDARSVPVTLVGYNPTEPADAPNEQGLTWDSSPDGSQTILGGAVLDQRHEQFQPAGNFDLLRMTGAGTEASPFAAVLEKLSNSETGTVTYTDNFDTWTAYPHWIVSTTDSWIPPLEAQSSDCQWLKKTTTGSTFSIAFDEHVTPAITRSPVTTGVREAKLTGHVLGWWFVDGVAQPVTLDIEYRLTAGYAIQGVSVGSPPRAWAIQHTDAGYGCGPVNHSVVIEEGLYNFTGSSTKTATERLTFRLKVGGTLIDTSVLAYDDTTHMVLSGSGVYQDLTSATRTRRLVADGVEIDVENEAWSLATFEPGQLGIYPERVIDVGNRFASGDPVTYWLPLLTGGSLPADIATVKWSCRPHWWSNHLVCLLRKKGPYVGAAGVGMVYGPTAHPSGVAPQVSSPASSPSENGPPLYGARDSLTGTVLLGQTEKITYV